MTKKNTTIFTVFATCLFLLIWFHPEPVAAETAEKKFYKAETCYGKLLKNPERRKYRDNWFPCIRQFQDAYTADRKGRFAAASLYNAGELYRELYKISFKSSDKKKSLEYFNLVLKNFSKSSYRAKAKAAIKKFSGGGTARKPVKAEATPSKPKYKKTRDPVYKNSKAKYKATLRKKKQTDTGRKRKNRPSGEKVTVSGLRVWSNPSYTRIVIDADGETEYRHELLDKDVSAHKPPRLYIDFDNSRLGGTIENIIPINDDLLSKARAAQYTNDSVRVVIDIKSFKTYKIFSLRDPFRTIIDVWGREAGGMFAFNTVREKPHREKKEEILREKKKKQSGEYAKMLNLTVRRIVIDPGHGGRDVGAVGPGNVYEKDVVLSIAKRLAAQIRKDLAGCEVILTRSTDKFLTLEERTAIANMQKADLFISLHTNAHKSSRAYGIETYFLSPRATDEDAILVAQRENAATRNQMSDLETILADLMQTSKINESSRLASYVQRSMIGNLNGKYNRIKNKGVKQALFYVLIGASMPSILVETSFISNKRECKRLVNPKYQVQMCIGIVNGIKRYMRETSPTAFKKNQRAGKSG